MKPQKVQERALVQVQEQGLARACLVNTQHHLQCMRRNSSHGHDRCEPFFGFAVLYALSESVHEAEQGRLLYKGQRAKRPYLPQVHSYCEPQ